MDFETYPQVVDRYGGAAGDSLVGSMERSDQIRPDWLGRPKPDRFASTTPGFEASMAAHQEAITTGIDGYVDPGSGLFVMTAQYLCDRGWCCDCGCRHCPFE